MTAVQHEWWGELRHGGMLVAPQFLDELVPELPALSEHAYDRLRGAWLKLDAALRSGADLDEERRTFAGQLLETFLGLTDWQKAGAVASEFKATSVTGEALRPNWALPDPDAEGALLAVWFDGSDTVGRGRGVRAHARLVELLRATGIPLGLLTNGRQFRLVHAGPDYDAWAEWDAQTWFDESEGRETLRGLVALAQADPDGRLDRLRGLIRTIRESRNRQGDLAQVLGEQVRQGIELLVGEVDHKLAADTDLHNALWTNPASGHQLSDDDAHAALYQAATRVVMRLVLILYAEARDLLPANVEAYHDSYGVGSLYDTLARADREGRDALAEATAAWPRMLSLFRLIYFGSGHVDLPVREYGGQLFRPGDRAAPEAVLRALAALEATRPSDAVVYRLLRLLKVGKVKVRAGRGARWVAGAVDFSDLRTEYVGIVYEGLLDYELRRSAPDDPIVLLNVGREPALPLSRLAELSAAELKELLKTFKKDAASAADASEDADDSEADAEQAATDDGADSDSDGGDEEELAADDEDEQTEDDAGAKVMAWAHEAVEAAGMVGRPRGKSPDVAAYEQKRAAAAEKLVAGVVAPGRLYLVASGGLRKGSGSFYTRPALSVPLAQRALEPLCYERQGDRLVPRAPEVILDLKVCEPAMGSGSFLVAALRYLVEALHRSLEHYGRIQPKGDRETVITLPFGAPATGEEHEELLDLPPEDDRFANRLRVQLARHVVERCLYGVDLNPMAVELARLALWVETLDRELPFEYLDHKLKVGNSLVGCWVHLVDDYPIKALDREDADGKSGERTKWLKQSFKDAKTELPAVIDAMGGATQLFGEIDEPVGDLVERVRKRFDALHELPRGEREQAYRELLTSEEYLALKRRMDTWCALWFWPAGDTAAPMPQTWRQLTLEQEAVLDDLVARQRFFHWEVEFPDAFTARRAGFDVVLGNPPWETLQPESLEFFSRHDPLYRTYGKTKALAKQQELFDAIPGLEAEWIAYQSGFKSMANVAKNAGDPFDISLARGKAGERLAGGWQLAREKREHLAHRSHPYRVQGSGKVYTYKLFVEMGHHLLRDGGRLGMLVPSGIYTDKGTTELRKEFLERCVWEWCYGFENSSRIFPIHADLKFTLVVVQRGGTTNALSASFKRTDVSDWERPEVRSLKLKVSDIFRFAPRTMSLMEFSSRKDIEITEAMYGSHRLLGDVVSSVGGTYSQEFNMTSAARHFVPRANLEKQGLLETDQDTRDPRVRAKLRLAGFLPLYEGKSFWLLDPYFKGKSAQDSVSKFVSATTLERELSGDHWKKPRLVFRDVASAKNQRSLIATVMPTGAHGNKAPSLDGLGDQVWPTVALLASLVSDYLLRMKIWNTINWFYAETLPVPDWSGTPFGDRASTIVRRLIAVGNDFAEPAEDPLISAEDRLASRLLLDSLVADLFALRPTDLRHIATRFPAYDRGVGDEYRYPTLVSLVYEVFCTDGLEAAEQRACELAASRGLAGVAFGLDELWQPDGGWEHANLEAQEILAAGAVA